MRSAWRALVAGCLAAAISAVVTPQSQGAERSRALEVPAASGVVPPESAGTGPWSAARRVPARVADSFHDLMREDFDPFAFPALRAASLIDAGRSGSWRPGDPDGYLARVDARTVQADRRTSRPDDFRKNFALNHPHVTSEVGTTHFFQSAGWVQWVVLVGVCVVLLWVDFAIFSKFPEGFKWHVLVVVLWIVFAVGYDMWIEGSLGNRRAFEWIYGYMLEWMLSMDNLFVFHLLFTTFRTPPSQQRKAVFVGIFCAVVFRLVFFLVVATLLHAFGWVRWPVGAMLIYSGVGAVWEGDDDDEMELKDMRTVRALRFCFGARVKDDYAEKPHLVTFDEQGRWHLTMLFVVVSIIELSDVVFALDSVSAKTAQIPDQYIAFSSSILAMYGLRAMFFVIQSLVEMFEFLKYGLALILVYIGVELMFANFFHLSKGLTCICILGIFALCIGASLVKRARPCEGCTSSVCERLPDFVKPCGLLGRRPTDS